VAVLLVPGIGVVAVLATQQAPVRKADEAQARVRPRCCRPPTSGRSRRDRPPPRPPRGRRGAPRSSRATFDSAAPASSISSSYRLPVRGSVMVAS
jgi:hypothetical protein